MVFYLKSLSNRTKEVIFQLLLHLVLFVFFSFDSRKPIIYPHQITFFISLAVAAFIVNYYLLPRFYYQKKYTLFLLLLSLVIAGTIILEEFVLEPYHFPNSSRSRTFPGLIYCLLDVMPMIIILSGFKFAWDASLKQQEVVALKESVKENELQFLKSQINPHFLFNNLNNLYSYSLTNSPKTPSIILELSSVLRYMLYDCKAHFVSLNKEITHLKNYTQLSELQIEDRGKITFTTDDIPKGYIIAPLILVVFIENAFKHSTASQSNNININININVNETGMLTFKCENTYRLTTNTNSLSKGIGLQNVQKRLNISYPNAHQLTLKENVPLYNVVLKMQLNKE